MRFNLLNVCLLACCLSLLGCANKQIENYAYVKPISFGESAADFWQDQVVYPYPVKTFSVSEAGESPWTLTYMDEGESDCIIVLLHGRGANAGYFSGLMSQLLEGGMRVIAVDIPHYGKSLPLNRLKPIERDFEKVRRQLHALLSRELKLEQYAVLGHSMGGQIALGYALAYPHQVTHLVLESSHGLEEFPSTLQLANGRTRPLFDPELNVDTVSFRQAWHGYGFWDQQQRMTEQDVSASHFVTKKSEAPGVYVEKSIDAYYMLHLRSQMIHRDPYNYTRYIDTYVRDLYEMGLETRLDDSASLTKKIGQLKMPVFMAFGKNDNLLPVSALSKNTSRLNDLARPAYLQLITHNNPPFVVEYAKAGHVIHADQPIPFARDVHAFVHTDEIVSKSVVFDLL